MSAGLLTILLSIGITSPLATSPFWRIGLDGYPQQHAFQVLMNCLIGNPQSPYSHFCENAIAERVVLGSIEMRIAVDLDGELGRCAIEIDYVSGDYLLPPEMESAKSVVSERVPQDFLLRRHPVAQISCELQLLASHELVSGYFHLTPSPSLLERGIGLDFFQTLTSALAGSPRLKGEGLGERLRSRRLRFLRA